MEMQWNPGPGAGREAGPTAPVPSPDARFLRLLPVQPPGKDPGKKRHRNPGEQGGVDHLADDERQGPMALEMMETCREDTKERAAGGTIALRLRHRQTAINAGEQERAEVSQRNRDNRKPLTARESDKGRICHHAIDMAENRGTELQVRLSPASPGEISQDTICDPLRNRRLCPMVPQAVKIRSEKD